MHNWKTFYLAAPYGKRNLVGPLAEEIAKTGIVSTADWIHSQDDQARMTESALAFSAAHDLDQIDKADVFIALTEPPYTPHTSGGRHVELGYALAKGKDVLVIGQYENIFQLLPPVRRFQNEHVLIAYLHQNNRPNDLPETPDTPAPLG